MGFEIVEFKEAKGDYDTDKIGRYFSAISNEENLRQNSTIVNFLDEHGEITSKEAEIITGKSAATVRRYFKMLVDTRYIVVEGNTNNIVYRISMNVSEND